MKNSEDLGGCYPPRPNAEVDNTLLDLQNSSYPTQPHPIIAKYCFSPRELCNDLKYCEDEPQRIGEVFAQSVNT